MPYELLAARRLDTIMRALRDRRELPQQLIFLNRTRVVNATDGEITARFTGNVIIADLVADDQAAVVRQTGSFELDQTKIPNIKLGKAIPQEMINLLDRINAGERINDVEGLITNYQQRLMDDNLLGVRQMMEKIIIGAKLNTLTYTNGGITFSATFGAPSDVLVTVATLWTDATNATPIADIQTQQALGREKYGKSWTRFVMNSVTFRAMIATTEFRNKATLYSQLVLPSAASFPIADMQTMQRIAGMLVGGTIELHDAQYHEQTSSGNTIAKKFLADHRVILEDPADDNSPNAIDFANGQVTESVVAQMTGVNAVIGGLPGGPRFGPISYATPKNINLNPPGIDIWSVARGFARRHDQAATSVLTVGA